MSGTLALVGSGEYLPPMEPVDRFLLSHLNDTPRVVCLPTAAGNEGPQRLGYWARLGIEHFARLGTRAEAIGVIDRASAENEALAARIRAANFVYLSGGKPGYLYKSLNGTRAWAAIESVLSHGGVVAGCSAGAMIFGERIPNIPLPWPWQPAFNYLPGAVVVPHFDEINSSFVGAMKAMTGPSALVGIDGNTALVRHNGQFTVAGRGGILVWNARKKRYLSGASVVWPPD
jgi:cyanophycinase